LLLSEEWEQIIEDEVKQALAIAQRALFSPHQDNALATRIREALKQKRF
jgi:hypothetical protein